MEDTAVIQEFRTALGGFNRQDVQNYIEQLTVAHRQELEALQKRLEEAESRGAQLEEGLSAAQAEAEAAKTEQVRLGDALGSSEKMVSRLRGELSQADAKLTVAKKEMERLRAQVASLEPLAAGYRELKDRVASVELDAHRRAQDEVNEARAEAERVRADTRKWLGRVMDEYGQLREKLDGVLRQVMTLEVLPERIEPLDETAQRLRNQGGLK